MNIFRLYVVKIVYVENFELIGCINVIVKFIILKSFVNVFDLY